MYNNKILQHYVEHEWNQTNSDLVVSGEQRRVATNDKELDESLAAEIQQVEFDVPGQDFHSVIEQSMDDLLTRIAKLHAGAAKLRKPHNPDPNDTHERPVTLRSSYEML